MKIELTIKESAKLIELGVDPKLASSNYVGRWVHYSTGSFADPDTVEPIFTLTDILSILPRRIYNLPLEMGIDRDEWYACYSNIRCSNSCFFAPELIGSLYQLLIWCIENGHYNPKNKEQCQKK